MGEYNELRFWATATGAASRERCEETAREEEGGGEGFGIPGCGAELPGHTALAPTQAATTNPTTSSTINHERRLARPSPKLRIHTRKYVCFVSFSPQHCS